MDNFKSYELNYFVTIAEENKSSFRSVYKIAKSFYQLCHVCLSIYLSLCPSVHPTVTPHGTTFLPLDGFLWNLIFEYFFPELCRKNSSFIKIWQVTSSTLDEHQYTFFIYISNFFLEWEMLQTEVVEKAKTHIVYPATFFLMSCQLWCNVEKYSTAGQATRDNMVHALCMWDTYVCKLTLRICNTY